MPKNRASFLFSFLALPILVALVLRVVLKFVLPTRIGWMGTQDFDLFVPFLLSGWWLAELLFYYQETEAKFRRQAFLKTLLLVSLTLAFAQIPYETWMSRPLWKTILFAGLVFSVGSAIVWNLRPQYFLSHPKRWLVLPALALAFAIPIYNHWGGALWANLGPYTSQSVCAVVSTFSPGTQCEMHGQSFMAIGNGRFGVLISQGCDGLAGLYIWSVVWATAVALAPKALSALGWAGLGCFGLVNLWALNILRITVLFLLGEPLTSLLGYGAGKWVFEFLFHAHLGLFLYAAGIFSTIYVGMRVFGTRSAFENLAAGVRLFLRPKTH